MSTILLVGCGRMGGALLAGWRGRQAWALHVFDPHAAQLEGATRLSDLRAIADLARPLTVVLAVKPQAAPDVAAQLRGLLRPDDLLLSIMASVTLASLRDLVGEAPGLIRAMPNIAVSQGRGASAAVSEPGGSSRHRETGEALLGAVGDVIWLPDEAMLHAATAICGSGPAYFFLLTERLAAAGARLGLPAEDARRLAWATLVGAGALAAEEPDVAGLRTQVTSPNGTTAAAIAAFEADDRLSALVDEATAAAVERSVRLSGEE